MTWKINRGRDSERRMLGAREQMRKRKPSIFDLYKELAWERENRKEHRKDTASE